MTKYHHEREPIQKPINVQTTEQDDQKPIVPDPLSDQPNESDGHPIDQANAKEPIIDQTEDSSMLHIHLSTKRHFSQTYNLIINREKTKIFKIMLLALRNCLIQLKETPCSV